MIILLNNEWIKFKNSPLMIWSIGIIMLPLIIGLALILLMDVANNMDSLKFMNAMLWITVRFTSLCLYTYVASEYMAIEFKTEVLKDQWTMPISRSSFYFAKIIFISLWSLLVTVLSYVVALLYVWVITYNTNDVMWTIDNVLFFIMASVLTWPFMYFSMMLIIKVKKVWLAMSINIFIFMISLLITTYPWTSGIPWISPIWIIFSMSSNSNIPSYLSLLSFTTVVLYLGHKFIYKVEV